jgi:hypothetical protein
MTDIEDGYRGCCWRQPEGSVATGWPPGLVGSMGDLGIG